MSIRDEDKSKDQLLAELHTLRERVVQLEAGEAKYRNRRPAYGERIRRDDYQQLARYDHRCR